MKRMAVTGTAVCILVGVLAFSMGCSRTKLAYNFFDWLLLERLDHYFLLNTSQRSLLQERIDRLLAWHRKHELPRITLVLTSFKTRYRNGLSREDLDWLLDEHKGFWRRFIQKSLPDFSSFLSTLEEAQIRHAEAKMEEGNEYLIRDTRMTREELRKDSSEWFLGILEGWFGNLRDEQKERIANWIPVDRKWARIKLDNRRKFQKAFAGLLRADREPDKIEHRLEQWVSRPETIWSAEFKIRVEQEKSAWKEILVRVDEMLSKEQRGHALRKIQGYIDDFGELAAAGA